MAGFDPKVTSAIQSEREIELTTYGRKTGHPSRRILWVYGDDQRIFVRSGGGLSRDWPRNLLANGRGILHVAGMDVPLGDLPANALPAERTPVRDADTFLDLQNAAPRHMHVITGTEGP